MIIIGGKFKGRTLKTPKGPQTRPTTSLLRKAFFDICQHQIRESSFLDLFAGSGAMGLEAISRGASHATFIEQDKQALRTLAENIETLGCKDQTTIARGNSLSFMKTLKESYHIIYVDPPYGQISLSEIITYIDTSSLLKEDGDLFLETRAPPPEKIEELSLHKLHLQRVRKFGSTLLYQFSYTETT